MTYVYVVKTIKLRILFLLSIALITDISGTTIFNMIVDKDIDSVMHRTKNRPLPSTRISVSTALFIALILVAVGVFISFLINILTGIASLLGFVIDVILYSILLKRRSWLSPLVGGIAGAMPFVGGWFAGGGDVLGSVSWVVSISLWSCSHIWALSAFYDEDYRRANIPTLYSSLPRSFTTFSSLSMLLASLSLFPILRIFSMLLLLPSVLYVMFILRREYLKAFRIATLWLLMLYSLLAILSVL